MTYYGRWTYKFEEAARQGALGIADRPRDQAGLLRLGDGQELQRQRAVRHRPQGPGQGARADGGLDPARRGRGAVQRRRAWISRPMKKQAQTRDFKPVALKGATLHRRLRRRRASRSSRTTWSGILPGTKRPDETVIYTAHWDHLGVGLPDAKGDTHLQRRRRQRHGHRRRPRARPGLRRRRRAPSARCCSWR